MTTRRHILAAASALAVGSPLSGCSEDGPPADGSAPRTSTGTAPRTSAGTATRTATGTDTEHSPPTGLVREDGQVVVDTAALTAGGLETERENGVTRFEYAEPVEAAFEIVGLQDGDTVTPGPDASPLATATLTPVDDVPRVFIVPAVDGTGWFAYEVFTNAAFVAIDGLHVIAGTSAAGDGEDGVGGHPAAFSEVVPGVYRESIDASDVPAADAGAELTVLVVDAPPADVRKQSVADHVTGVALLDVPYRRGPPAPHVSFSFDQRNGSVSVTHNGGDSFEAANVTVVLDDEPTPTQFDGTVGAGDTITVDASAADPGATIRVVWTNPETGEARVIAQYELD